MKYSALFLSSIVALLACGGDENSVAETPTPEIQADIMTVACTMGEELGDSTSTFGILVDAEYHQPTGNILVLDSGRSCLKEYTPEGEYIRQISRQGNGPGELSVASFEFFQMFGNTLVLNAAKGGFVVFDDSLEFVEELPHWIQNPPMQCVALSDSGFVAYKPDFKEGSGEGEFMLYRRLVSFGYGDEGYDTVFWADSMEYSLSQLVSGGASEMINDFLLGITVGGNQDIVLFALCESDEYIVHCYGQDGTELLTIEMDLEPVAKTEEEIAEEKAYMEGFMNQMGGGMPGGYEPEPFRDMIKRVAVGPDGNIWVQRGTEEQPLFDIFNLQGEHIGNRMFERSGWSWQFSISEQGILAWEDDPELGYQQLHVVDWE